MTLYDAILSYETQQVNASFDRMQERNKFLQSFLRKGHRDKEIQKITVILNAAFALGDSDLTEENLDSVFAEVIDKDTRMEKIQLTLNDNYSRVNPDRREYVRESILFYQQLVKQEGLSESFEDACRNQFLTYENLENAYDAIVAAQEKYLLTFGSAVEAIRKLGMDKMGIEIAKERVLRCLVDVFGE